MKVISYSIFNKCQPYELNYYLRGLYFNLRMNKLIYPQWKSYVHIELALMDKYNDYFNELKRLFDFHGDILKSGPLCTMMLWRMIPLFEDAEVLICRDADSIITYKESQFINYWVEKTNAPCSSINDNPAHHGIMGGLCGFKRGAFKEKKFSEFIDGYDLTKRGSDQTLINQKYKGEVFNNKNFISGNASPLWESNLIPAFMGSAGVNEMEAIRFFKRFDPVQYDDFEKRFANLFYWHL